VIYITVTTNKRKYYISLTMYDCISTKGVVFAIWFVCLCVMWITVKVGDGLTHTNLQTNSLADNKEKVNIWLISDN